MRWAGRAALTAIFLAGVTTTGFGALPDQGAAPAKEAAKTASPSFDDVVGKKLVSIEGSSIAVMPSEGGLSREIVAPNGAVENSFFAFINNRLGTVSEGADGATVIGVFRSMDAGIEIQYADGATETLAANSSGGITSQSISAAGDSCRAWYPEGHVFSVDERKAALAQYAIRLGLADPNDKKAEAASKAICLASIARGAEIRPQADISGKETRVGRPLLAGAGGAAAAKAAVAPKAIDVAAAAQAIEVRTSEIHPIDPPPADAHAPQVLASANPPQGSAPPDQRGASSCLSVESDGSHWGFRNHCAYAVQFAYCLMSAADRLASCSDSPVTGGVAGNGFGALVADESLKETDAAHDFRWVACQGGAGEVIPRLDQMNPPTGRCVR